MWLAASAHAEYTVTVDPESRLPPRFELELPAHHGNVVETRAAQFGLSSQVKAPRCGSQQLVLAEPGRWTIPAACRRVEWEVDFAAPPVDAAAQRSVAFARWWLITDQTALLRIAGDGAASTLTIKTPGQPDRVRYVPSSDDAPEFYALGGVQETTRTVCGVRVRYAADDLARVTQRGLIDAHAEALAVLHRLFPSSATGPFADELGVVFVGNATQGNGAGGARSLLVDYALGTSSDTPDTFEQDVFFRAILAHEQFHQLAALHHSDGGSTWFGEGLAHYYGLKTMQRSHVRADDKAKIWKLFVDPQRPVTAGLVELMRRYAGGDQSVYPLFYQQGATFFAELDRALQEVSGGKKSLDDFVPRLRSNPDGTLPNDLLVALRAVGGKRIDELVSRYVGH
ncbi:hypothetical protein D7S89_23305 [Trinickia fusca]|uniref:Peptidase M61 catalytic domain-containing protein n=2 Tax=Trinickia fusca TaxID=2419777 RepID=A0A494X038_9BURK|nr:hypothetical protein D7S89_23305 [Trinickia fusca]